MNHRLLSALVISAFLTCLGVPAHSANEPDRANGGVIPAGYGASLEPAALQEVPADVKLVRKGNRSYYLDGRIAEEKAGSEFRVYTYHDAVNGHTVFTRNLNTGEFTIREYRDKKLVSVLYSNGAFHRYNADGTVGQKISVDRRGLSVIEDYRYTKYADGRLKTVVLTVNGRYESTTSYVYEGRSTVKTIDQYTGAQWVYRDGLLVSFTERTDMGWKTGGMVTAYSYTYDKQGRLEQRIGVRSDGYTTVYDYKNRTTQARVTPPVNSQKVLAAALDSVKDSAVQTVKTNDGNVYILQGGFLLQMQRQGARYVFDKGLLVKIVLRDGRVITF